VSLALQSLAADRPVVLLLDDCQFIDRSSVALVEHLIGDGSHSPLLVVGATRGRVAEQSPWDELLVRLDVDRACAEVNLSGLTGADVVAVLPDHVVGRDEMARRLCIHTGGNPRFVHELLANGVPDDDATWPAAVQDVFARRLVAAASSTQRLVGAGGIVGSRFDVATATTLAGIDQGAVDAACDEAVALGLIEADGATSMRFCADAARAASVDRIDPAERLDMRVRVGSLLTANASAAVVATYYRDAMDVVAAEAATWAQRAGDEAMHLLGFGEAIEHYAEALRVRAMLPSDPLPTRARLLVALGHARHAAYDWQGALAAFRDAATVAESAGAFDLVADAACGLAGSAEFTLGDADALEVLERASVRPGLAPARRAVLLAGLARLLPTSDPRAWDLADEAVALARAGGDRRSLATALGARCLVQWGPDDGVERARRADEVVTLAEHIGWVDLQMEAHNWRATALEEMGDHDGARRDVAILTTWAAQSRRPFFQGLAHLRRTSAALREGDLATVDALLASPPVIAASSPNFASGFGAQFFFAERWRGTAPALVPVLSDAVAATPAIPAWRAPLALALALGGDVDAARRVLADALATTFPCDWLWLGAHVVLADAAVYADDVSAARCLYDRLASHAEHNVLLAHGVVSFGSASRPRRARRRARTRRRSRAPPRGSRCANIASGGARRRRRHRSNWRAYRARDDSAEAGSPSPTRLHGRRLRPRRPPVPPELVCSKTRA
jgi:tetratricopeptide (TPR) repeat protein